MFHEKKLYLVDFRLELILKRGDMDETTNEYRQVQKKAFFETDKGFSLHSFHDVARIRHLDYISLPAHVWFKPCF